MGRSRLVCNVHYKDLEMSRRLRRFAPMKGEISLFINGRRVSTTVYGSKSARRKIVRDWRDTFNLERLTHTHDVQLHVDPWEYPPQKPEAKPERPKPKLKQPYARPVIDESTGLVYPSLVAAAGALGIGKDKLYFWLTRATKNPSTLRFHKL